MLCVQVCLLLIKWEAEEAAHLKGVPGMQLLREAPLAGIMQVALHLELPHQLSILSVACVHSHYPKADVLRPLHDKS